MKYSPLFFFFLIFSGILNFAFGQDLNITMQNYRAGKYETAIPDFVKTIPFIEKNYGKLDTIYYSRILFYTANSYKGLSNFEKAKDYFLQTSAVYENLKTDKSTVYAESCISLGDIFKFLGDYNKAQEFNIKAKNSYEHLFGKKHPKYALACNNSALLYKSEGNFAAAEKLLIEAKNIYKNTYGKKHPDYATVCDNLASVYQKSGNYNKAEQLFLEAKSVKELLYGKKDGRYAFECNNLAGLYYELGNYDKAESLYSEAKNIYKNSSKINRSEYAGICNNLGQLYTAEKEYDKAITYFDNAKNIYENLYGKNNKDYLTVINNLAGLYAEKGEFKQAEDLYTEIKQITGNLQGTQHTDYADVCNNLAALYYWKGNYEKAEPLYLEAQKIYLTLYGKRHYNYAVNCLNLALLYDASGKYKKAETYYLQADEIINYLASKSAEFMSENERECYINAFVSNNADIYLSFFSDYAQTDKKLGGTLYNDALNLKGQLLKSAAAIRKAVMQTKDPAFISDYKKMNETAKIISEQYALSVNKRRSDLIRLEEKENILEKRIVRKYQTIPEFSNLKQRNWSDIQKSLKDKDVAIEFIDFKYHTNKNMIKGLRYYALILRKDYDYPKVVFLFKESKLDKLLHRNSGENEFQYIKNLYDPKSKKADSLYRLIWKPLKPYLKKVKNIYISPSGLLNKISFDALPSDTSTLISDKYKIIYTTNTSELVNDVGLFPDKIKNSVLFGGLKYEIAPAEMKSLALKFRSINSDIQIDTSDNERLPDSENIDSLTRNVVWNYLPGTLEEATEIQTVIKKNAVPVTFYQGEEGTEEQFKALENDAPSVLHISTHGFYFPENELSESVRNIINLKVQFVFSENPLLRSGFILAGGNRAFQGAAIPAGIEDGVLTASEISHLNFFNTKLVVLSACQTGLGDVKGYEGVYGLQRAFKMAGVDYLLFSLWEVPDEATKELMAAFYENWFSGKDIRTAFKDAQNQLKEKYKGVPGSAFAWAAFVLKK